MHGVRETNPLDVSYRELQQTIDRQNPVAFTDPRLVRILRLRLISDPGHPEWEVSYCDGELEDGTRVAVSIPWQFFRKRGLNGELFRMCKESGRHGKRLGIYGAVSLCC